jgi:WXG100 family type VII secretion target
MPFMIRLEKPGLLGAANTFAQEGHETMQLYQRLNSESDELHGSGFIGRSADAFRRGMEGTILPKTKKLATLLDRSAQYLKIAHAAFEAAEDDSAGIFKKLYS